MAKHEFEVALKRPEAADSVFIVVSADRMGDYLDDGWERVTHIGAPVLDGQDIPKDLQVPPVPEIEQLPVFDISSDEPVLEPPPPPPELTIPGDKTKAKK